MRDVKIAVTKPQREFINHADRYPLFCGGFGAGKSQALVIRTLKQALTTGQHQGFFAPTYDLLRLIAFPRFETILSEWKIGYKLNKSESVLYLANGAQVIMRTMDAPERIVGFEVADACVDELDTLKPAHAAEAWQKIIARCRLKKASGEANTTAVGTTPEGFRFVYDRWVLNRQPGYAMVKAPTASNPHLPPGYLESLTASYPPAALAAYTQGEFVNLASGNVYPNFDRRLNHTDATLRPGEPLHVGMDFNVGRMAAIVSVIRDGEPLTVAELLKIRDTADMAEKIRDRYRGHSITVYPDASGKARKTVNSTESDHKILRDAGFTVLVNPSNPAVRDRVMSVNAMMLAADGRRRWKINTDACPVLTGLLERQAYDHNGDPVKDDTEDPIDALGYFLTHRFGIVKRTPSTVQIIGI